MNKREFINLLSEKLSYLPKNELEERIIFYCEMINDKMDDGLSEEEAINEIGPIDDIVKEISSDNIGTKEAEAIKEKRTMKTWEIVLICLGFPIWLSLGIAAVSIVLSIYAVIWSLVITCWALAVSFAVSSIPGLVLGFVFMFIVNPVSGFAIVGASILLAGLAILLFIGSLEFTKIVIKLTRKIFKLIINKKEVK